jgi:hypothetical protein
MRIAILSREDDRSPKVLAFSLQHILWENGHECDILFQLGTLIRLWPWYKKPRFINPLIKRLYAKLKFLRTDKKIIQSLSEYDLIVISDCTPNAFWRNLYQVELLREKISKPICLHEVYYLGNAPTQIAKLKKYGDPTEERYDWHFSVSDVTEIKSKPGKGWSRVGLCLTHTGLAPLAKEEFLVVVDFEQHCFEQNRKDQIEVLKELGIKYIALEGLYKMDELREIYKKACFFLIQSPEAFCIPIAECLSTGAVIGTASSAWPMSWRLDENPQVHSEGVLPDFFIEYKNIAGLKRLLLEIKDNYDLNKTPYQVFNAFVKTYPHYYYGDKTALKQMLDFFNVRNNKA